MQSLWANLAGPKPRGVGRILEAFDVDGRAYGRRLPPGLAVAAIRNVVRTSTSTARIRQRTMAGPPYSLSTVVAVRAGCLGASLGVNPLGLSVFTTWSW